jgi:hypothetical protein
MPVTYSGNDVLMMGRYISSQHWRIRGQNANLFLFCLLKKLKILSSNTHDHALSAFPFQTVILSIILLPFRTICIMVLLVLAWALAHVGLYGLSREELTSKPLTGWRK